MAEEKEKEEKKEKRKKGKNRHEKKKKRAQRGTSRDGSKKMIFYLRTVKRNRNEIEAQKNWILSPRQKIRK